MDLPRVPRELEAMAALREPTRRRLYQYVERQPDAVSRDEAAEAIGISRALAAFHLDKLVEVGVLKAEYRRLSGRSGPGAGRTSKLYRRSRHQFAVSLPHRDHELLARILAASFDSSAEVSPAAEQAREYGRSLGRHARKRLGGDPGAARLLDCVEAVLERLGFEPYRASNSSRLEVLVVAGERQTGLLDVRVGDAAIETAAAGKEIDGKTDGFGTGLEKPAHGDGRRSRHSTREQLTSPW